MKYATIGMCIVIIFLAWLQDWIPIKNREFWNKGLISSIVLIRYEAKLRVDAKNAWFTPNLWSVFWRWCRSSNPIKLSQFVLQMRISLLTLHQRNRGCLPISIVDGLTLIKPKSAPLFSAWNYAPWKSLDRLGFVDQSFSRKILIKRTSCQSLLHFLTNTS